MSYWVESEYGTLVNLETGTLIAHCHFSDFGSDDIHWQIQFSHIAHDRLAVAKTIKGYPTQAELIQAWARLKKRLGVEEL